MRKAGRPLDLRHRGRAEKRKRCSFAGGGGAAPSMRSTVARVWSSRRIEARAGRAQRDRRRRHGAHDAAGGGHHHRGSLAFGRVLEANPGCV
jgi:hypothetical protein